MQCRYCQKTVGQVKSGHNVSGTQRYRCKTCQKNYIKAYAHQLPPAPVPQQVETAEMDELYTFIQHKKTRSAS